MKCKWGRWDELISRCKVLLYVWKLEPRKVPASWRLWKGLLLHSSSYKWWDHGQAVEANCSEWHGVGSRARVVKCGARFPAPAFPTLWAGCLTPGQEEKPLLGLFGRAFVIWLPHSGESQTTWRWKKRMEMQNAKMKRQILYGKHEPTMVWNI